MNTPRAILEIYRRAEKDIDRVLDEIERTEDRAPWNDDMSLSSGEFALHYGPAHIVWSDGNWDCTAFCLKACDSPRFGDWPQGVLDIIRRSLRELAALQDAPAP